MWDFPASRSGYKRAEAVNLVPLLAEALGDILTEENSRLACFRSGQAVTAGDTGAPVSGRPALALSGMRVRIPCFKRIPRWRGLWNRQNDSAGNLESMKTILGKPGVWARLFNHCPAFALELEVEMPDGAPRVKARLRPLGGHKPQTIRNSVRNMKKLFWAGMFVLALCLPAPAATGKGNAPDAAPEGSQNAATVEEGVCYRRSNCMTSFLESVTQAGCWNNGGNSWKAAAAGECINNPEPE